MGATPERLIRTATRPLVCAVGLAVAYFALSWLSLSYISTDTGVAVLWPASGVALAAFALAPRRWWPAFTVAVFAGNLVAQLLVRDPIGVSAALAAVSALEPLAAGYVLVRVAGRERVEITSVRAVSGLAVAGFGVNALTAALGTAVLVAAVNGPVMSTWESWWLADGVGMLVVTPLLLALVRPQPGRASTLEAVGLVWLAGAVALALFAHDAGTGPVLLGRAFPLLPMLLWCALRLGTRAATVAIVLVSVIATVCTADGHGPFALPSWTQLQSAQALQAFLAIAVLSTLMVGAVVAGQRRLERRASEEAERLSGVLQASDAAIIAMDLRGMITLWNAGAERMLGYTAQEMLGSRSPGLHDPDELRARADELGLEPGFDLFAHAGLRSERRDWTWITKDGRRLTVSHTMTPQRDRDGRLNGFLAVATDVTAKREAVRRLAASEQRLRLMLANMPDTQIFLYDRDLVCVMAEGQTIPADMDLLGRPVGELLLAAGVAHLRPLWDAALDGESEHATFVSARDGRHQELHVVPYRDASGAPDGVLVVVRDVSELRAQEQAVRRAEADLRTIFAQAPIGNAVFDPHLNLVDANSALTAMTGYAADELGDALRSALTDTRERQLQLARVRRGAEHETELDVALTHADGHAVDLELHVVGLGTEGDREGARRRMLVQVVDVSERKRFEERLRRLADHDPLTGVLNRRRFDQEVAAHVARVRRYGVAGALLLVDVDGFKQVNDTQGHAAGDAVIIAVANTLGARLRASDALGRLGGDEFAILLPQGGLEDARTVAAALVEAIRHDTGMTVSVGVAPVGNAERLTPEQLMREADRAMYAVKAAGRDGYAIFGEPLVRTDRAASAGRPSLSTS
jgi:diguanylate cyclase (GGDEF)-like protein/PAS domain S-box-containing protein